MVDLQEICGGGLDLLFSLCQLVMTMLFTKVYVRGDAIFAVFDDYAIEQDE